MITLTSRHNRRFGVAAVDLRVLESRMSDVALGVHVSARVDSPEGSRRVWVAVATVYVMIGININVIMILWRNFIVSKRHTNILQSLTKVLR